MEAEPGNVPPPIRLLQMLHGKLLAQAICAVAELRVADHLDDRPERCAVLAHKTGTHAESLYRLLRLLASFGIFTECDEGVFAHTALSLFLKSDVPGSIQPIARMIGSEWHSIAETKTLHSLRTGQTAFQLIHGTDVFDYLARNRDAAAIFDQAMTGLSEATNHAIGQALDFSNARLVVDVGGGHGSLLLSILSANTHLRGILMDAPTVLSGAVKSVSAAGLGDRCSLVEGNFFDSVPGGGDVYLLKYILHDWNDNDAIRILRSCREAASEGSKLVIVEDLIGARDAPSNAKLTDIEMLVIFGGRERTEQEYKHLLSKAGFELERVVPTGLPAFLLEAAPA